MTEPNNDQPTHEQIIFMLQRKPLKDASPDELTRVIFEDAKLTAILRQAPLFNQALESIHRGHCTTNEGLIAFAYFAIASLLNQRLALEKELNFTAKDWHDLLTPIGSLIAMMSQEMARLAAPECNVQNALAAVEQICLGLYKLHQWRYQAQSRKTTPTIQFLTQQQFDVLRKECLADREKGERVDDWGDIPVHIIDEGASIEDILNPNQPQRDPFREENTDDA